MLLGKTAKFFQNQKPEEHQGDKAVDFFFPLDQELMELAEKKSWIDIISRTTLDCVDQFAPERYGVYKKLPSNDWINIRIKNALT